MITIPARYVSSRRYSEVHCPTVVAAAPSMMNTTLKPSTNIREFSITFANTGWRLSAAAAPVPEIRDTYPGKSGNTKGERKETIPAKNAAIGSGAACIDCYFTNSHQKRCPAGQFVTK